MIIEFLDGANRAAATPLQLEAYDLLKDKMTESDEVFLADLLEALGLKDHRPLLSRIKHLAEKGLIRLRHENDEEQVAVA